MYKAIIFDLDGTLLNTARDIQSVINDSLKRFNLSGISLEQTMRFVGNGARKLVERAVGERLDLVEEVYRDYSVNFANCDNRFATLYEGEEQALKNFKAANIKTAIVTNKPYDATMRVFDRFLAKFGFNEVLCQTKQYPLKPDPSATLHAIKSFGVKKRECLFVGDGETDVQTAANAGVDCVSVLWGFRSKKQLEDAGARLFANSFKELGDIVFNN